MMSNEKAELVMRRWYEKAQLDYGDLYMRLYVSYNAWYRTVTRSDFDREAISRLKRRVGIWIDYVNKTSLDGLAPFVQQIAALTQRKPVAVVRGKWNGQVASADDWQGLIEFWYQIRCSLFHGAEESDTRFLTFTKLAYESLNIFMTEVIHRMNEGLTINERALLEDIEKLEKIDELVYIKQQRNVLRKKFLNSTDIWNVDVYWRKNEG